jgi:hypothetical protein
MYVSMNFVIRTQRTQRKEVEEHKAQFSLHTLPSS